MAQADFADAQKEKKAVALSSVLASLFLTGGKLIIGLLTGSLGILSEAAHSALDFGAAAITYFAVSISDKPADKEHHYGHGKVENFSALVEALLLMVTCLWIVKEAINRLMMPELRLEVTAWGFGVLVVSIIIDFSRSRALKKAAKKHKSQALEADALHFSSDILSSLVVIVGLVFAKFGYEKADPIAALVVAVLVIIASLRLAKETVDGLLDRAPEGIRQRIESDVTGVPGVLGLHKIRVRRVGPKIFGDLHVLVDGNKTIKEGHQLADRVEDVLAKYASDVVIHIEPVEEVMKEDIITEEDLKKILEKAMERLGGKFVNYHELSLRYDYIAGPVGGVHLVLPQGLPLNEAHHIAHSIEEEIMANYPGTKFNVKIEPCAGTCTECALVCDD